MKNLFTLLMVVIVVLTSSCKKENPQPTQSTQNISSNNQNNNSNDTINSADTTSGDLLFKLKLAVDTRIPASEVDSIFIAHYSGVYNYNIGLVDWSCTDSITITLSDFSPSFNGGFLIFDGKRINVPFSVNTDDTYNQYKIIIYLNTSNTYDTALKLFMFGSNFPDAFPSYGFNTLVVDGKTRFIGVQN